MYPAGPAGEDIATEANRAAVRNSDLDTWLPAWGTVDDSGDIVSQGIFPDCSSVHAPTEFAGFGVLSVVSVPVTGARRHRDDQCPRPWQHRLRLDRLGLRRHPDVARHRHPRRRRGRVGEGLGCPPHLDPSIRPEDTGAAYTASGSVPGDLRNQFSLSEHEGHLRVVTTSGDTWDGSSESFVRVLRETDGELVEVGSVGDMGNGEAVQSVRFVGDVGYVVTFRQIDPFYTLDLRDPENPASSANSRFPASPATSTRSVTAGCSGSVPMLISTAGSPVRRFRSST